MCYDNAYTYSRLIVTVCKLLLQVLMRGCPMCEMYWEGPSYIAGKLFHRAFQTLPTICFKCNPVLVNSASSPDNADILSTTFEHWHKNLISFADANTYCSDNFIDELMKVSLQVNTLLSVRWSITNWIACRIDRNSQLNISHSILIISCHFYINKSGLEWKAQSTHANQTCGVWYTNYI